jgi:hypothetical protein
MPILVSLADIRDVFIIIYGVLGIIFFFIASIVTLVVGLTIRALLRNVGNMMDESLKPTLASVQDAAATFKGTTEFIGKTTITPIVRTYGIFAGVRKALSVFGTVTGRKRR